TQGQSAPGVPGGTLDFVSTPILLINSAGTVLVQCRVQTGAGLVSALYAGPGGGAGLTPVAIGGQPAGGRAGDARQTFGPAWINGAGQVLFQASVLNPQQGSVWMLFGGLPGGLVKVVAAGDVLQIGQGQTATISGIELTADSSGGQDGGSPSLNDSGQ